MTLLAIFLAAYLGVRMADSPVGLLGELRVLVSLPFFLVDLARGRIPTDADIARERTRLEEMHRDQHQ